MKYETFLRRKKFGLCTTWIYNQILNKKSVKIPFMIKDGDFPKMTISDNVIMICIGTGIAPIRNLLWNRFSELDNSEQIGKSLLFYGCRSKDTDYLYNNELEQFVNDKRLKYFFS